MAAATGDKNHTCLSNEYLIWIWDLKNNKIHQTLTKHTENIKDIIFTPDGKLLLSCSTDGTVKLWHIKTGKVVRTFRTYQSRFTSMTFSPKGNLIAADGGEKISMWLSLPEISFNTTK